MPRYDGTEELSGAEYLASIYGTEKGLPQEKSEIDILLVIKLLVNL